MGVLAMLATILFAAALVCGTVLLLMVHRLRLLKYVFGAALVWFVGYGALLIGTSAASRDSVLAVGEHKNFCGFYLDCHIMAKVNDVKIQKEFKGRTAKGEFRIVEIEVLSDARETRLRLRSPEFLVSDDSFVVYKPLKELSTPSSDFEKQISPGESWKGVLVFDMPEGSQRPRLDVRSDDPINSFVESFVIGDEDSLFHARQYFSIEAPLNNLRSRR